MWPPVKMSLTPLPYGKTISLKVEPSGTTETVKAETLDEEGTPPDQLRLTLAGQPLAAGTVSDGSIGRSQLSVPCRDFAVTLRKEGSLTPLARAA